MICDIKRLTGDTVIPFLQKLGGDSSVFSNCCQKLEPLLSNHKVYLYADDDEIVVVALDPRPRHTSELADEEPFNGEHPLWFSESSHRESPVWRLATTCQMFRERLRNTGYSYMAVWGVLLTSCEVINYDDMLMCWELLQVSVFHRMKELRSLSLAVNTDMTLDGSLLLQLLYRNKPYHADDIKLAEKALRRLMGDDTEEVEVAKKAKEPQQPQLFNFDDDDDDLFGFDADDFDCEDSDSTGSDYVIKSRTSGIMSEVSDISLQIATGSNKVLYTNGSAVVTLTAVKGNWFFPDTYSCSIYTSDFCLMANSDKAGEEKRPKGNILTLTLPCSEIWLPGHYFMLLSNNDCSFERVDFTLDEQLKATLGERQGCSLLSQEDVLLSYVGKHETNWKQLATQPGTAQFRRFVVNRIQLDVYNSYRNSRKCRPIGSYVNLLICKRNNDIDQDFLYNLYKLSAMEKRQFIYADCEQLYDASRSNPYEQMHEELDFVKQRVICLTNIGTLLCAGGKIIIKRMLEVMRNRDNENSLWICGTRQEIDALLSLYPSLNGFFLRDSRLEQEQYSPFEMVQSFRSCLAEELLDLTPDVKDALSRAILKGCQNGGMSAWTLDRIRRFVDEEVRPRYLKHAFKSFMAENLAAISEDDLCLEMLSSSMSSFEESMRELNEMIGLDAVKESICTMANNARLYMERRRRGLKSSDKMVFHCIFTGNPGTGKTTVAKMLGRIYHSLGLLSKGEVVEVDRTRLIGRFIGETEENVKLLLEEARGNVLFIDEAYALCTDADDRKDFGMRVIDSLMTVLSQPDPDMLIVFAGYPAEMSRLLATNPGLSSRFPYRYLFPDYNSEQLMQIARCLLERDDYVLTDEATIALQNVIEQVLQKKAKDFGNARYISQLVKNGILPELANRVFSTADCEDFQHVEASDIRMAFEKISPKTAEQKPGPKKVMGFRA